MDYILESRTPGVMPNTEYTLISGRRPGKNWLAKTCEGEIRQRVSEAINTAWEEELLYGKPGGAKPHGILNMGDTMETIFVEGADLKRRDGVPVKAWVVVESISVYPVSVLFENGNTGSYTLDGIYDKDVQNNYKDVVLPGIPTTKEALKEALQEMLNENVDESTCPAAALRDLVDEDCIENSCGNHWDKIREAAMKLKTDA